MKNINDIEGKLVFNAFVARELLVKYGHPIIDLKKNRDPQRPDSTIFVFEKTEQFMKDLEMVSSLARK